MNPAQGVRHFAAAWVVAIGPSGCISLHRADGEIREAPRDLPGCRYEWSIEDARFQEGRIAEDHWRPADLFWQRNLDALLHTLPSACPTRAADSPKARLSTYYHEGPVDVGELSLVFSMFLTLGASPWTFSREYTVCMELEEAGAGRLVSTANGKIRSAENFWAHGEPAAPFQQSVRQKESLLRKLTVDAWNRLGTPGGAATCAAWLARERPH